MTISKFHHACGVNQGSTFWSSARSAFSLRQVLSYIVLLGGVAESHWKMAESILFSFKERRSLTHPALIWGFSELGVDSH